jgi:exodeoxyribonuclease-3
MPKMKLRVTTWNINSLRLRLPLVKKLLAETRPHVLCLQEIKVSDEHFPHDAVAALGFPHRAVYGVPGRNGVAILSRVPLDGVGRLDWCGRRDGRHIYATLPGGLELHNIYVPAGGDVPDPELNEKFAHKLQFLAEIEAWLRKRRRRGTKPGGSARTVLVGDLNVAPLETDVWSHTQLLDVVSHTPIEVDHLTRWQKALDWVDAMRHFVPPERKLYTWWSYRNRDWKVSDRGRRLDHVWVTPDLKTALVAGEVLRPARDWDNPSDHVPVTMTLDVRG